MIGDFLSLYGVVEVAELSKTKASEAITKLIELEKK